MRHLLVAAAVRMGGSEARAEAELLLAHALDRSRAWLFAWPEFEPDARSRALFEGLVQARARGEPIAYLLGQRAFWSLDLRVTPAVLIPRPETELLVERALVRLPAEDEYRIADLGTGSGAIALALGSERPRARVLATDASEAALDVARANAHRLAIGNVRFAQGDWCDALGSGLFDLIVSNPPYIAADDPHLGIGDLRHEPPAALISGSDGLDAIRAIAAGACDRLEHGGWLLLEHGRDQAASVQELLASAGLADIETSVDLEGRPRVTAARRPP